MPEIVLTTLNAKYIHASIGLRYLQANLAELRSGSKILEFDLNQRASDCAEVILREEPVIVGLGVYIWNAAESLALVSVLKKIRPELIIVLGGPEVSYEWEDQEIVKLADFLVVGEGDLAFADLCRSLLASRRPTEKIVLASTPDLATVASPCGLYSDDDIAHRIIYVEASRGCPFECEFCLSSLDIPVRRFPLEPFLNDLRRLLDRGVRHFKFVDRTFNVHPETGRVILEFFLTSFQPGMLLHFEMIPDRLPPALRDLIVQFPPGALQFEVGIQTFDPQVQARIQRRQDERKTEENLRFLKEETGVHIHADLIVGLPGESLTMFAAGFDRLLALGPQEIQVGILKRLRGTPIGRHDEEWGMVYRSEPPYDLLKNTLLDFATMQRLKRFARYWDLVANSGRFVRLAPCIWKGAASPFQAFLDFSDWLFGKVGRHHSIALDRLASLVLEYLTEKMNQPSDEVTGLLKNDFLAVGRSLPLPRQRRHAVGPA